MNTEASCSTILEKSVESKEPTEPKEDEPTQVLEDKVQHAKELIEKQKQVKKAEDDEVMQFDL